MTLEGQKTRREGENEKEPKENKGMSPGWSFWKKTSTHQWGAALLLSNWELRPRWKCWLQLPLPS